MGASLGQSLGHPKARVEGHLEVKSRVHPEAGVRGHLEAGVGEPLKAKFGGCHEGDPEA